MQLRRNGRLLIQPRLLSPVLVFVVAIAATRGRRSRSLTDSTAQDVPRLAASLPTHSSRSVCRPGSGQKSRRWNSRSSFWAAWKSIGAPIFTPSRDAWYFPPSGIAVRSSTSRSGSFSLTSKGISIQAPAPLAGLTEALGVRNRPAACG